MSNIRIYILSKERKKERKIEKERNVIKYKFSNPKNIYTSEHNNLGEYSATVFLTQSLNEQRQMDLIQICILEIE